MIKSIKNLTKSVKRYHEVIALEKAPKVQERMIWINVENADGYLERIQGKIGTSLFEALKEAQTKVGGWCYGPEEFNVREKPIENNTYPPKCILCFVEIGEHWNKRMPTHWQEQNVLDKTEMFPFDRKLKRLSCCITVESWMNEIHVRIPYLLPDNDTDIVDDYI